MTVIWLLVWLVHHTPQLHKWNNWAIALIICAAIDVTGIVEEWIRRH